MNLQGKRIGFALTGSFCTFEQVTAALQELVKQGADVYPIMSEAAYELDTKFGSACGWRNVVESITGKGIVHSIVGAEPIGPGKTLDLVIVAPCTGNTIAKLANAVTDTPVTMAVKAHLRNGRPVLIAVSTNDGLGLNAKNIGLLLGARHIYFVPFGQDNPTGKPTSLVANMSMIPEAASQALDGKQIQPLLVARIAH